MTLLRTIGAAVLVVAAMPAFSSDVTADARERAATREEAARSRGRSDPGRADESADTGRPGSGTTSCDCPCTPLHEGSSGRQQRPADRRDPDPLFDSGG